MLRLIFQHQHCRKTFDMQTTNAKTETIHITPEALATSIKALREQKHWSQEQLAEVSRLSVRTVQRVEKCEPSTVDTRRALARAFDVEDIDIFNKPFEVEISEELEQKRIAFEKQHVTLEAELIQTGRALANLTEGATGTVVTEACELGRDAAELYARLTDYVRDYLDCASLYSAVQKIDVYDDLHKLIMALGESGISICCALQTTQILGKNWPDQTPMPVSILYMTAFTKGSEPKTFVVKRDVQMGI